MVPFFILQNIVAQRGRLHPFLDALASLDLKLSVSESVIYRFQLAHLRVFKIIFACLVTYQKQTLDVLLKSMVLIINQL